MHEPPTVVVGLPALTGSASTAGHVVPQAATARPVAAERIQPPEHKIAHRPAPTEKLPLASRTAAQLRGATIRRSMKRRDAHGTAPTAPVKFQSTLLGAPLR